MTSSKFCAILGEYSISYNLYSFLWSSLTKKIPNKKDKNLEQKIITKFIFAIVAAGGIAFIGIDIGIIGSPEQFGYKDEIPFNSNYWQLLDESGAEVANGEANSKSDAEFCANEKAIK